MASARLAPRCTGHLGELPAHPQGGVQRGHRVLEDHGEFGAEPWVRAQVVPVEAEGSGRDPARVRHQVRQRQRAQALAGSRFADQADGLARADVQRDPAYRLPPAGERHPQVAGPDQSPAVVLDGRFVRCSRLLRRRLRCLWRPSATGLCEHLADQPEHQPRQDDGRAGRQGGRRIHEDAVQLFVEQPPPVVLRRLYAEAEEGEAGEGDQDAPCRLGGEQHRRFGDVGQQMTYHHPEPAHAEDPGGRDVVGTRDRRRQVLHQPRHGRDHGQPHGEHRAGAAHPEDRGEEEQEQQPRKGHQHTHGRGDQPPEAPSHDRRGDTEQQPAADSDHGGHQGEPQSQPGGHHDPGGDVPAELVRAQQMGGAAALVDRVGVDLRGPVAEQHGAEYGDQRDQQAGGERGDADRRPEGTPEPVPQ
ncbi:hypothetical protein GCM10009647_042900 [Streptomyces sanglieri]